MRNGSELGLEGVVDEVVLHNLLEGLQRERGMYREDVVHGGKDGLRCCSHMDSETVEPIAKEDTGDNNVDIDDEVGGGRGYEVVDYSGSLVQNVDRERLGGLVEQLAQHVLHLSHRGTFPWGDEYASSVNLV